MEVGIHGWCTDAQGRVAQKLIFCSDVASSPSVMPAPVFAVEAPSLLLFRQTRGFVDPFPYWQLLWVVLVHLVTVGGYFNQVGSVCSAHPCVHGTTSRAGVECCILGWVHCCALYTRVSTRPFENRHYCMA